MKHKKTKNKIRKKASKNFTLIIITLIAMLVVLANAYLLFSNYKLSNSIKNLQTEVEEPYLNYTLPELNLSDNPLSTDNFTQVKVNLTEKFILLETNCSSIGLATHEVQMYSIRQGFKKSIDIRPTIHDLMKAVLENYNITVLMIKITDARDDLYFSNLYLKKDNELLNIDAKPSDAIAIALRTNSPIYVKNSILEMYGNYTC